jgi:hypothetical protein
MRTLLSLLILPSLLSACAAPRAAAPPSADPARDRARLGAHLEESRRAFVESVKGLSDAQLRWKPAPERWSVLETAEHIALAEERIYNNIHDKVLATPLTPELRARLSPDDDRIPRALADRSRKRHAPEALVPTGRFASIDDLVAAFEKSRARTVELAQSDADLRGHAMEHPALGPIDGYQWLLFLSSHCARHTAQINEVKADPGFPKS